MCRCAGAGNWESLFADCRESRTGGTTCRDDGRQKTVAVVLTAHRRDSEIRLQISRRNAALCGFLLQIHDHVLPSGECVGHRTTQPAAYNRLTVTVS